VTRVDVNALACLEGSADVLKDLLILLARETNAKWQRKEFNFDFPASSITGLSKRFAIRQLPVKILGVGQVNNTVYPSTQEMFE